MDRREGLSQVSAETWKWLMEGPLATISCICINKKAGVGGSLCV